MEKKERIIRAARIQRSSSTIERGCWREQGLICGVDEVGRGCLIGPLVTAAVVLHPGARCALLKDSKILCAVQRERAARWIVQHSWYAIGMVSHDEIDTFNIYQATLRAMRRAVCNVISLLPQQLHLIVVDAMPLSFAHGELKEIPVQHFPFAESRSISVAAASIVAKVKRDAIMKRFDQVFPGYLLSEHKGYATASHRHSLACNGRCIVHRDSFLKKIQTYDEKPECEQQDLFCRDC